MNEVLRREVDRQRKKADLNEAVIAQLKKELERYAYELIKLQESKKIEDRIKRVVIVEESEEGDCN